MANDKMTDLLESLLRRTQSGRISWEVGSRPDTFIWSATNASVVLSTADNDGSSPWRVKIVNGEGMTVEEREYNWSRTPADAPLLDRLYDAARGDALDISSTIEGLLEDLNDE